MLRKTMLLTLLAMPLTAFAQAGGDMQAQILYAFETEDLHALSDLEAGLQARLASGDGDAVLHYHLAHAAYRYSMLVMRDNTGAAARVAGLCINELKEILRWDDRNVEALVLQSACYEQQAVTRPIEAALLRTFAAERTKKALRLAPRNPRALFVAALAEAGRERGLALLRTAAEAFGQASATAADEPGWGDAEAYLTLGTDLNRRGDRIGARNWIERALIVSPDYQAAQRAHLELSGH